MPHHTQGKEEYNKKGGPVVSHDTREIDPLDRMVGIIHDTKAHTYRDVTPEEMGHEPSKGWEKEFDTFFDVRSFPADNAASWNPPTFFVIKDFIRSVESRAREEERAICREIYVHGADWEEWGMSDEEVGKDFDDAREAINK